MLGAQTANVLNELPKSQQPKAKRALQEIWMAETKKDSVKAFDAFIVTYGVKYEKAVECLTEDRLRISRRALEATAHVEPDREHLRHGASPNGAHQRVSVKQDRARHDLHARSGRREKLASSRRSKPTTESNPQR
jgi:hypothetical protein